MMLRCCSEPLIGVIFRLIFTSYFGYQIQLECYRFNSKVSFLPYVDHLYLNRHLFRKGAGCIAEHAIAQNS